MTVNTNDTVERYEIDGTGPYAFSFRIFAKSDLSVKVMADDDEAATTLTLDTHYTIADASVNDEDGGELTLIGSAETTYDGYILDIRSNTPLTQPTSITNQGPYSGRSTEAAFDRLSRQIQDTNRKVLNALRVPDSETTDTSLPAIPTRASKFLRFDANGVPEAATGIDQSQTLSQSVIGQYLYPRTDAEIAEGVAPTDYAYPPGDMWMSSTIGRLGGSPSASASDNVAAAQEILDSQGVLTLASGTYSFNDELDLGNGACILGEKGKSVLLFTGATNGLHITGTNPEFVIRGLNIRTSNAAALAAIMVDTAAAGATNSILDQIDITKNGSGRWAHGVWASGWQTSDIRKLKIMQSATVGLHLENFCNALQFYGLEVVGSSGAGTIERAIELSSSSSTWELYFTGGTLQGYFTKALLHSDGVSPLMSGFHLENTNASPTDGADVVLDGTSQSPRNCKFTRIQGGSFLTVGTIRNFDVSHSEIGDFTLGSATQQSGLTNSRSQTYTDNGALNYRYGCGDNSGNRLADIIGMPQLSVTGISATTTVPKNLRGSATFASAATRAVSFGTAEPDATYFVSISGGANETFWVTSKGTGGFTLNSSNATSTATVDWHLIR